MDGTSPHLTPTPAPWLGRVVSLAVHGVALAGLATLSARLPLSAVSPAPVTVAVTIAMVPAQHSAAGTDAEPVPPIVAPVPQLVPAPPRPARHAAVLKPTLPPSSSPAAAANAVEPVPPTDAGSTTVGAGAESIDPSAPTLDSGGGSSDHPARYQMGTPENPVPAYPQSSRRKGHQGTVLIRLSLSADGIPEEVSVLHSSGHPLLDEAAAATLKDWRLRPALRQGRAVASVLDVPVMFVLN